MDISGSTDMLSATGLTCVWRWLQQFIQAENGFIICLLLIFILFVFAIGFWWRRRVEPEKPALPAKETRADQTGSTSVECRSGDSDRRSSSPGVYRFRKRDKAVYTAKKLLRKVKNLGLSAGNGANRRRASVIKYATQWMSKTKEKQALRPPRGPPSTFFEPDTAIGENAVWPPEVLYMLENIRVFGHFETPCFMELCRHVTERALSKGEYLFRPGDPDDSIYVVQRGLLSVYIWDNDEEFEVKKVGPGESIYSLLSILDVLSGHSSPFKTVAAKAIEESTVLKLSGMAFNEIFEVYPESWVRTIQIIALRLQRVTFTTLHHYLGLSTELTKPTLREIPRRPRMPSGSADAPKAPYGRANSLSSRAFRYFGYGQQSQQAPEAPSDPTHEAEPAASAPGETAPTTSTAAPAVAAAPLPPSGRVPAGPSQVIDEEQLRKTAKEQLTDLLGLSADAELLDGKIAVHTYPPGHTLTEQGSEAVDLIYVVTGALEMLQKTVEDGKPIIAAVVHSRELVGGLAVLTGEPSFYTIKTRIPSRVAIISKDSFYQIMRAKPRVVLNIAHTVVMRLSPFIRSVDFSLDWEMLDGGKALYNQGDASDSLYVVLSGRLRSVVKKSDTDKRIISEYGRGDLVGLVEVVTSRPRATTVISVRYTELAKLPNGLLTYIKMKFPQVLTRIIHLLGHCILGQQEDKLTPAPYGVSCSIEAAPHVANFNTIAVVPVSDDVPLGPFALELLHALKAITPTLLLSRDVIERDLGGTTLLPVNEYHLLSWLSRQEDAYPMVLYQCDYKLTPWSWRCIRQADCVLIVANGESTPTVGPLEDVFDRAVRARKNLILLWPENAERPVNTHGWLDACGWVSSYYHIRAPYRMYIHARRDPRKVREFYDQRMAKQQVNALSDFARLARMLTGRAIGLVLGGGGARGASHLGILRALKEHNIPIDIVGGVSIGSFVGGLYCSDPDIGRVIQKAREWFMDMAPFTKYLMELTYPYSAIFTGSGFNRLLQKVFADRLIEDTWIPYFNITTDITASQMRVHRNGDLWRYIRASMSIAGVFPPLCDPRDGHYLVDGCYVNNVPGPLWRYCRASMSLAGYYPPICDPNDDHQLLDGGYVNNLPADVMRSMGVSKIIAVDVGSQDETNLTNYGDSLNGFWVLLQRINPWAKPMRVLNMAEIQSRLAYVCCVRQLEEVKKAPYCYYVRPPIDKYQTLDFALFDEICNVGLQHGKAVLHEWICEGKLAELLQGGDEASEDDHRKERLCHTYHSPQSFTDLAAYVSKIEPRHQWSMLSDVSDEETEEMDGLEETRGNVE